MRKFCGLAKSAQARCLRIEASFGAFEEDVDRGRCFLAQVGLKGDVRKFGILDSKN